MATAKKAGAKRASAAKVPTLEVRIGTQRFAQGGPPGPALFARDESVLVVGATSTGVWSVATGERLACLEPRGHAAALALSHDGARLFVARSGEVHGFETAAWQHERSWPATDRKGLDVRRLVVSRDGALLYGSVDDHAVAWEAASGRVVWRAAGGGSLALSDDGALLATASPREGEPGHVLDAATGRARSTLGNAGWGPLQFGPDGAHLIGGSRGGLRVWDITTGALVGEVSAHGGKGVRGLVVVSGALWSWGQDDLVCRWERSDDAGGMRVAQTFAVPTGGYNGVLSPSGRYFADPGNNVLCVRDLTAGGAPVHADASGRRPKLRSIDVSDDGSNLVTCDDLGTSRVWTLPGGDLVFEAKRLALHCAAGSTELFVHRTAQRALEHFAPEGAARATQGLTTVDVGYRGLVFAADGSYWVYCTVDRVRCHERDGRLRWEQPAQQPGYPLLSRDGAALVVSECDAQGFALRMLWLDPRTGARQRSLKLRRAVERPAAISEDGLLVALRIDGALRWFSLLDGEPVARVRESEGVGPVVFSPDGARVAYGTSTGAVAVVSAVSGKGAVRWDAHYAAVTGLRFSRDGKRLYSCGDDSTAAVWVLPP